MSSSASRPSDIKFRPKDDWTLISQGAEARLWKIPDFAGLSRGGAGGKGGDGDDERGSTRPGAAAVAKERFSKRYRHPKLDERLTSQRCRAEARILQKCSKHPHLVRVPALLAVDAPVLYIEFLPFPTLRSYLEDVLTKQAASESESHSQRQLALEVAAQLGSLLSNLHYELGIAHGDLTTSNFLIEAPTGGVPVGARDLAPPPCPKNPLVLIDFGLAKCTESAEERAVDLYVLERALLSTHPQLPDQFFERVLSAYGGRGSGASADPGAGAASKSPHLSGKGQRSSSKARASALARLEQVRLRGRKRECFG